DVVCVGDKDVGSVLAQSPAPRHTHLWLNILCPPPIRAAQHFNFKKQLEQSFPCRRHGKSIYTPVIGNRGTCQDSMWISSPTTYSPTTSGTHNLCREAKAL
ncbi:hypothetical protein KUCAC02_003284, partial [Chaenocephalus aceratus]